MFEGKIIIPIAKPVPIIEGICNKKSSPKAALPILSEKRFTSLCLASTNHVSG
jgi:hypothetical protein